MCIVCKNVTLPIVVVLKHGLLLLREEHGLKVLRTNYQRFGLGTGENYLMKSFIVCTFHLPLLELLDQEG
jgi:hypothetical protein